MTTRGVVYVHSAPSALCPHVEWALTGVLGAAGQPGLDPAARRPRDLPRRALLAGSARHRGDGGLGAARLGAPALRGHRGADGAPRAPGSAAPRSSGSSTRSPASTATSSSRRTGCAPPSSGWGREGGDLAEEIDKLLGKPWDDELETFRWAGEGAPVRWLHQVG